MLEPSLKSSLDLDVFKSYFLAERLQMEEALAFSAGEVAPSSSSVEEIDTTLDEEQMEGGSSSAMDQLQEDLLVALSLTKEDAQLEADGELNYLHFLIGSSSFFLTFRRFFHSYSRSRSRKHCCSPSRRHEQDVC